MSEIISNNPKAHSGSFLGVRVSIWKVVAVLAGAGSGALISGHVYSDETTFGAIIGLLIGESLQ